MKTYKLINKIISMLLAASIIISEIPVTVFASEMPVYEDVNTEVDIESAGMQEGQIGESDEQVDIELPVLENTEVVAQEIIVGDVQEDEMPLQPEADEQNEEILGAVAQTITGTISLPEDAIVECPGENDYLYGTVYAFYNDGYGYRYANFRFNEGDTSVDYEIKLNDGEETDTIYKLYYSLYTSGKAKTNLITSNSLYYTADGWTSDSSLAESISIPDNKVDFTLETAALYGYLKIPEGTSIESPESYYYKNVTVYAYVGGRSYSCSASLYDGDTEAFYVMSSLPAGVTSVDKLYYYINTNYDNYIKHKIATNQNIYYTKDNGYTRVFSEEECKIDITGRKIDLQLQKTNCIVKVSLDESVQFSGGDLEGTLYVYYDYLDANGTARYSSQSLSLKFSEEDRDKPVEKCFNSVFFDVEKIKYAYIKWANKAGVECNFNTGVDLYFNGTQWGIVNTNTEIPLKLDGSATDIKFSTNKKHISFKISLPEGADILSGTLNKQIYVKTKSGSDTREFSKKYVIQAGEKETTVYFPVPDDTDSISYINTDFNQDFNVSAPFKWTYRLYYSGADVWGTASSSQLKDFSIPAGVVNLTLPKANCISGMVKLPADAFVDVSKLSGKVTVNVKNGTGSTDYSNNFSIEPGKREVSYCVSFNDKEPTYVNRIRVDVNSHSNTNVNTGTFYYTQDGLTTVQADAYKFDILSPDQEVDISLETGKSIHGRITLPENIFIHNGNVSLKMYAYDGKNTTNNTIVISEEKLSESIEYNIPLKGTAESVKRLYYSFDVPSNVLTNIDVGSGYKYVTEDGGFTTVADDAFEIPVNEIGKVTEKDIRISKRASISGVISLPSDTEYSGGQLVASVYLYDDKGGRSASFEIPEGDTSFSYQMPLNSGATKFKYGYVYLGVKDYKTIESNIPDGVLSNYFYFDKSGKLYSDSYSIDEEEIGVSEYEINVKIPFKNVIKGVIKLPDDVVLEAKSSYSSYEDAGIIKGKITAGGESFEFTLSKDEREAAYELILPPRYVNVNYIQVYLDDNNYTTTDLKTGYSYVDADGNIFTQSGNVEKQIFIGGDVFIRDITLRCKKFIEGDFIVPEGQEKSGVSGTLKCEVNGTAYTKYFSLSGRNVVDGKIPYTVELPLEAEQIDRMYIVMNESYNEDCTMLTGTYFYSHTLNKWGCAYWQATAVPLSGKKTHMDIPLVEKVVIKGEVKLAEGSYFKNADLTGYVNAYINGTAYNSYFTISEGEDSARYSIQLPDTSEEISKLEVKIYKNTLIDTNIVMDKSMYLADDKWVSDSSNAKSIALTGKINQKDIILPESNMITGKISLPEGIEETVKGNVTVICNNIEYTAPFEVGADGTNYSITLPSDDNQNYSLYYKLDTANFDRFVIGQVYVDKNGEYNTSSKFVQGSKVLAGRNEHNIKIATWEMIGADELVGSQHPYSNSKEYNLEYTSPVNASSLKIDFSKYTFVESTFDDMSVYWYNSSLEDEDKWVLAGTYTGDELAGESITISGNAVKIAISSDDNKAHYGFGINSIEAVGAQLPSDVTISPVKENDVVTKMMIHSGAATEKQYYTSNANYDENSKMLDITSKKLVVVKGMGCADVDVVTAGDASLAKLMLYDSNLAPICSEWYKVVPRHAITYHYIYTTFDAPKTSYYADEEIVNEPSEPTRPGYKFGGWYMDEGFTDKFVFGETISEDYDLYTKWIQTNSISFSSKGGGKIESEDVNELYADAGKDITLKAVPNEGWVFSKWIYEGIDVEDSTSDTLAFTMPNKDVTAIAVFERAFAVEWTHSSVKYTDSEGVEHEQLFDDNNEMFVFGDSEESKDVKAITLTGKIPSKYGEVTEVEYLYTYYESSSEGDPELKEMSGTAAIENGVFKLEDFPVNYGSNTLTILAGENEGTYYIIKNKSEIEVQENVEVMSLKDMTDKMKIDNFVSGIAAFWNYDNDTPDDTSDDMTVLIVNKEAEIAQRLMMDDSEPQALRVGNIWVIPPCDQFPLGYSFKIEDVGDAEYAPKPNEYNDFYGKSFSSEEYLYILSSEPEWGEVYNDSFSFNAEGIKDVAFVMIPESSQAEVSILDEAGEILAETVYGENILGGEDKIKEGQAGWQPQNIYESFKPNIKISDINKKATFGVNFADTVIYDHDGKNKTENDRITLGGSYTIKDIDPKLYWQDPSFAKILPNQVGFLVDWTEEREFKAEYNFNGLSLEEVVKKFKEKAGSTSNEKDLGKFFGSEWKASGVDMDGTIVLAAAGFTLLPFSSLGGGSYDTIASASTFMGLEPILVVMLCMDISGEVSAKVTVSYTKSTYNALGLNVVRQGVKPVDDARLDELAPKISASVNKFDIDVYQAAQVARNNTAIPAGKLTITAEGVAKANTDVAGCAAIMMSGLNILQVKGGIYVDAEARGKGHISNKTDFNIPKLDSSSDSKKLVENDFDIGGALSAELTVGAFVRADAKFVVEKDNDKKKNKKDDKKDDSDWGDSEVEVGFDKSELLHKKLPIWSMYFSTMGISGKVTEGSSTLAGSDVPLSNVNVTLTGPEPSVKTEKVTTDAEGKYSFKKTLPGKYTLKFEKAGYTTIEQEVEMDDKSEKEHDVQMKIDAFNEIKGFVVDSQNKKIKSYRVSLKNLKDTTKTIRGVISSDGSYLIGKKDDSSKGLPPGKYRLTLEVTDYKTVTRDILIPSSSTGSTITLDDIMVIKGLYGNATLSGEIHDVATGKSTGAALDVRVRRGQNNQTGEIVDIYTLKEDGKFSFKAPAGYYTLEVIDNRSGINDAERYGTIFFDMTVEAKKETKVIKDVSNSMNTDQVRIQLDWGATPSDLDSHLVGPTGDGLNRFHTFYANKTYYYKNELYADLDRDDVTSYGPEVTTIYFSNASGKYSFYIQDFSNRGNSSSTAMANSQATITVTVGNTEVAKYKVPNSPGTVWHVFDYDAGSKTFIESGRVTHTSNPSDVGTSSIYGASGDDEMTDIEAEDIAMIMRDMVEK